MAEAWRVEMKVCECCGRFWLRRAGAAEVYCERCEPVMAEMPGRAGADDGHAAAGRA